MQSSSPCAELPANHALPPLSVVKPTRVGGCKCTGHKLCLSEAPDVLAFDQEQDVAFVKPEASSYYAAEVEGIYAAAMVCPMEAIYISGEVLKVQGKEGVRVSYVQCASGRTASTCPAAVRRCLKQA